MYSILTTSILYLQNEIENLKQTLADMEEKVQYQSDERLRDVNEVLENCQTRVNLFFNKSIPFILQQFSTLELGFVDLLIA